MSKLALEWNRSPEIEGWLNRIISSEHWDYWPVVDVNDIDWPASLAAQNREGKELHGPTVASITESIKARQPVPPLILRQQPKGKLIVVNGNHRGAAARGLGVESVAAYVVSVDDDTFYLLSATANAVNGREAGAEFILRSAAYAVSVKGFPAAKVAPMFGLAPRTLLDYLQAKEGVAKLRNAGVRVDVPITKAIEIARLDQDQATYLAAELSHASVTADAARKAISAIKSKSAVKQQEEVVAQRSALAEIIEHKGRATSTPRRRTEVAKALQHLSAITEAGLRAALSTADDADKARIVAAMESAASRLQAVRNGS